MLYFPRWKALRSWSRCFSFALPRCRISFPKAWSRVPNGAAPHRARPRPAGGSHLLLEVDVNAVRRRKSKRCVTTCAAFYAIRASAIRAYCPCDTVEVRIRDVATNRSAKQATRIVAATRGLLGAPASAASTSAMRARLIRLRVTEPRRMSVSGNRSISRSRSLNAASMNSHSGAFHPAPGCGSHPGAGARSAEPFAPQVYLAIPPSSPSASSTCR